MTLFERTFRRHQLDDPPFLRFIFGNTAMAPLWLMARLYLGYQWLISGSRKVWGDDRWIGVSGTDGLGLKSHWERATAIPGQGSAQIQYDWYRDFLRFLIEHEAYTWFSWVIAIGEVAAGLALIIGVFTGLAAFAGATLNFNFLLAGSASVNPVMFVIAVLIMLGWKVAGWIGVDRWLLPALCGPWEPGPVARAAPTGRTGVHRPGSLPP